MTLKIEDVKPGDIISFQEGFLFALVVKLDEKISFLWLSRNSDEYDRTKYTIMNRDIAIDYWLGEKCRPKIIANLDVKTFIEELRELIKKE